MKFYENYFRKYEERYCAKHGRDKFLKNMPRKFIFYIVYSVLVFLLGVTILILGINDITFLFYQSRSLIIAGVMLVLVTIVMSFLILPPYWRLVKKCRDELNQSED